jgi:hypothetical protein
VNSTAAPQWTAPPDWSHEYTLERRAPSRDARAFVHVHLAAHELRSLVDVASVVAAILTRDVASRGGSALVLSLARHDALIRLAVDDRSEWQSHRTPGVSLLDVEAGSGILGLLTERWGVSPVAGHLTGLWATFEVPGGRG